MGSSPTTNRPDPVLHVCRCVVIGDWQCGKTSLLARYANNTFSKIYEQTIGVGFTTKEEPIKDKIIQFQIHDGAGAAQFRGDIRSYYKSSEVVIIAIRPTETWSTSIDYWNNQIDFLGTEILKVLVCTHMNSLLSDPWKIGREIFCSMKQKTLKPTSEWDSELVWSSILPPEVVFYILRFLLPNPDRRDLEKKAQEIGAVIYFVDSESGDGVKGAFVDIATRIELAQSKLKRLKQKTWD